ncbi:MAG: M20/M25/M40 family metallo-hydrolase [Phocaeicola sp.]
MPNIQISYESFNVKCSTFVTSLLTFSRLFFRRLFIADMYASFYTRLRFLMLCTLWSVALSSCMSIRTVKYANPPKIATVSHQFRNIDTLQAVQNLSRSIQIPTHSLAGEYINASQPFLDLHDFLAEAYPHIHQVAVRTVVNKYSLVFYFEGSNASLDPGLFLAHQDVVPAPDADLWEHAPFSGAIADGYIYGRGSLDMKSTLIALMEGMEQLLKEGFIPERGIYFCFGHDEEIPTQEGAPEIVKWMQAQQITPAFVIDEGGILLDGISDESNHRFAFIGTSEKGYVDIEMTQTSSSGHSSLPAYPTTVLRLAESIRKIEKKPMKPLLTPALRQTVHMAAPYLPFKYRWLAANLDLFFPLAKSSITRIPLANALISTTYIPTMLSASEAPNVIPKEAKVLLNVRIIEGHTCEDVRNHIQKVAGDGVRVSYTNGSDPIPMSPIDVEYYKHLTDAVLSVAPQSINVPYCFIATTDSRYYYPICKNIYRFTPLLLTLEDQYRYHSINERCSIDNLALAIHFYISYFERIGIPSQFSAE